MRVELLLRSGVNYGSRTLEGRLLSRHFDHEAVFRYGVVKWLFDRVLDLIKVAGFGSVDPSSAKSFEKAAGDQATTILDVINPFKEQLEEEKRKRAKDDARREKYVEELAKKSLRGYGSLKEIKEALGLLQNTIKEAGSK